MPRPSSASGIHKWSYGGYYVGTESRSVIGGIRHIPDRDGSFRFSRFMKFERRPSQNLISLLLAMLSFLSLTLLPAIANPRSCCMQPAAAAESCVCSQAAACCQESTPTSLAQDRTTVTEKQVRSAQVPYNAAVWTPATQLVRLAATRQAFNTPVKQVHSDNKRYLMLRVLLI